MSANSEPNVPVAPRRRRHPSHRAALWTPLALLLAAGIWLGVESRPRPTPSAAPSAPEFVMTTGFNRPVYPYSVVPGGVRSREELQAAAARDAIAAAHFTGLRTGLLQPVALAAGRKAHVSYRMGDKVYWTRRPVPLQRGETVLTDGKESVRARCGNRISEEPRLPVSPVEPEPSAWDTALSFIDTGLGAMPPADATPAWGEGVAEPAGRIGFSNIGPPQAQTAAEWEPFSPWVGRTPTTGGVGGALVSEEPEARLDVPEPFYQAPPSNAILLPPGTSAALLAGEVRARSDPAAAWTVARIVPDARIPSVVADIRWRSETPTPPGKPNPPPDDPATPSGGDKPPGGPWTPPFHPPGILPPGEEPPGTPPGEITSIPEPVTPALAALGLIAFYFLRRSRRSPAD